MKKVIFALLVIIKNATVVIPLFEGMLNGLANLINQEEEKKAKQNEKKSDVEFKECE